MPRLRLVTIELYNSPSHVPSTRSTVGKGRTTEDGQQELGPRCYVAPAAYVVVKEG